MLPMQKLQFFGNKNIFGTSIMKARDRMQISQHDLAVKMQLMNLNIDQQTISKIECNRRIITDFEFACFCEILNLNSEELLQEFLKYYENQSSNPPRTRSGAR